MTENRKQANKEKPQNKPDRSTRIDEQSGPQEMALRESISGTVDVMRAIEGSRKISPKAILSLQRTVGNRSVNRILDNPAISAANQAGQPSIQREDESSEEEREALQKRKQELEAIYGEIKAKIAESFGVNLPGTVAGLLAMGNPGAVAAKVKKQAKDHAIAEKVKSTELNWIMNGLSDRGGGGDSSSLSAMKNGLNEIFKSDSSFKDKIASVRGLENQFGNRIGVKFVDQSGKTRFQAASQILASVYQNSKSWFEQEKQPILDQKLGKLSRTLEEFVQVDRQLAG